MTATIPAASGQGRGQRLDSWKEIARYLRRDVRTVQGWEKKEGLPVHRHAHSARASIYAYAAELDAWLEARRIAPDQARGAAKDAPEVPGMPDVPAADQPAARRRGRVVVGIGAAIVASLVIGWLAYRERQDRLTVALQQPPTLAVLPFDDLSADPNESLVADGLTDDIITELGRSGLLAVISRRSVAQFKGTHTPLPQVARSLHATLILEGAIVHSGKSIRITAQLIDAATDHQLWAESYERDSVNVLSLQDNVASAVASAVLEKLTGREPPAGRPVHPVAPDVRLAYLTGRYFWSKRDEPGLRQAIVYFDQAIRADSAYSPAYSGLADCYNLLGTWGFVPESIAFPAAKAAAQRAIQLDPTSAEAYNSLAFETYRHEWDFVHAEQYFQQAIRVNPNYSTAHQWYGEFLGDLKRSDQSVAESRKAVELDPLSAIAGSDLADSYLHAGRDPEALAELQHVLALYPSFSVARGYLATVYFDMGRMDRYVAELALASDTATDPISRAVLHVAEAWVAGDSALARARAKEFARRAPAGRVNFMTLAVLSAVVHEPDAAFAALERSYRRHEWWLVTLKSEPYFASIRDDPRYRDLIRRIGIP